MVGGVTAGNVTFGHRFMGNGAPIAVRRFDDYAAALDAAKVVLDAERRKAIIEIEATNLAFAQGLEVVHDPGLIDETARWIHMEGVGKPKPPAVRSFMWLNRALFSRRFAGSPHVPRSQTITDSSAPGRRSTTLFGTKRRDSSR